MLSPHEPHLSQGLPAVGISFVRVHGRKLYNCLSPAIFDRWKTANGGSKTYRVILSGGGGERTIERALQNQFWRPQKVGLVWSVPVSCKEMTGRGQRGGETYHRRCPKPVLGRGFMVCFSPPRSFPPFVFFSLRSQRKSHLGATKSSRDSSGSSRIAAATEEIRVTLVRSDSDRQPHDEAFIPPTKTDLFFFVSLFLGELAGKIAAKTLPSRRKLLQIIYQIKKQFIFATITKMLCM